MPIPWAQLESWMRPKILQVLTKDIRDWVNMRARQNVIDPSHVLVFYLMKNFAPGGAEEKVQLTNSILNPNLALRHALLRWDF